MLQILMNLRNDVFLNEILIYCEKTSFYHTPTFLGCFVSMTTLLEIMTSQVGNYQDGKPAAVVPGTGKFMFRIDVNIIYIYIYICIFISAPST